MLTYNQFLLNVCTVLEPLHKLLRTDVEWEWMMELDRAFKTTKEMLKAKPLLNHYGLSNPLLGLLGADHPSQVISPRRVLGLLHLRHGVSTGS